MSGERTLILVLCALAVVQFLMFAHATTRAMEAERRERAMQEIAQRLYDTLSRFAVRLEADPPPLPPGLRVTDPQQ